MTWAAVVAALAKAVEAIASLIPLVLAYFGGKARQRATALDAGLKGLNDALDARDLSRGDADRRERLRRKYRQ